MSQLWLQEKVVQGLFHVIKVKTNENKSDALTKHVSRSDLDWHMKGTGQEEYVELSNSDGTMI